MIFFHFITTDCSWTGAQDAETITKSLGEWFVISCRPHHCPGQYIIEHLNHITSHWVLIQQTESRKANVTIESLGNAGYIRCSKRCYDGAQNSPFSYFNVVGMLNMNTGSIRQ